MLDDRLDADERRALLLLLTSVALSDGELSESEVRFVQRFALPLGIEVTDLLAAIDGTTTDAQCARLRRPVAARIAVLELVRLAHVDEVYCQAEQRAVHEVARKLGVADRTAQRIEAWVQKEWELLAVGRKLVDRG
jgi:hypothetical protein